MNYTSLVSDLQTYMLRTDTPYLAKIPDIIQQGIIRIYNNAKDIGFEQYLQKKLLADRFILGKPGGWRETVSLSLITTKAERKFLLPRSFEYCRTYWPNRDVTGEPKYYSETASLIVGASAYSNIEIVPTSNLNYNMDWIYLGIPLFNEANSTNFLTLRYPNFLLYSCLLEASLFLDNEQKQAKYQAMFDQELDTINRMNVDRTTDRTVIRDKS